MLLIRFLVGTTFLFNIFNIENPSKDSKTVTNNKVKIELKTKEGGKIEKLIMANVLSLMNDIDKDAVTKEKFDILLSMVMNKTGSLKEEWFKTIKTFCLSGDRYLSIFYLSYICKSLI
jgi:hypothetical protein